MIIKCICCLVGWYVLVLILLQIVYNKIHGDKQHFSEKLRKTGYCNMSIWKRNTLRVYEEISFEKKGLNSKTEISCKEMTDNLRNKQVFNLQSSPNITENDMRGAYKMDGNLVKSHNLAVILKWRGGVRIIGVNLKLILKTNRKTLGTNVFKEI